MKKILLFCCLIMATISVTPVHSFAQKDTVEISDGALILRTYRYRAVICPVTSVHRNYTNDVLTIRGGNGQLETVWASNIQQLIIEGSSGAFSWINFDREIEKLIRNSAIRISSGSPGEIAVFDQYSNETLGFINDKLSKGPGLSANSISVTPATDILFPNNLTHVGNNVIATNTGVMSSGTIRTCEATDAPTFGTTTAATAPTRMQLQGSIYNSTAPSLSNGQSIAVQGDINGRILVNGITNGSMSQSSATITTGNTSQTCINSNTNRRGFEIINTSASTLYISFSGAATTSSIPITAGSRYSRWEGKIPSNTITILGPSAGLTYITLEIN